MSTDQVLTLVAIVGISLVLALAIAGAILYASSRSARGYRQQKERRARSPSLSPPPPPPPPLPEPQPLRRIEFDAPYEASPPPPGSIQWDVAPRQMDTDPLAVRCPVCRHGVTSGDTVRCPTCETVYHRSCWEYVSGVCPNCRTH